MLDMCLLKYKKKIQQMTSLYEDVFEVSQGTFLYVTISTYI